MTISKALTWSACAALALGALTGCANRFEKRLPDFAARAFFGPTGATPRGMRIEGTIDFEQRKGVVTAKGEITGLKPNASLGFHVHEKSNCMGDASGAGPHFNPSGAAHGAFDSKAPHHVGDLPPLKTDAKGKAVVSFTTTAFSLDKTMDNGVIDRAMIVHADADDPAAQPAGNSGARVACGIIRLQ